MSNRETITTKMPNVKAQTPNEIQSVTQPFRVDLNQGYLPAPAEASFAQAGTLELQLFGLDLKFGF